jgi:lipid A 3-O-deacylase
MQSSKRRHGRLGFLAATALLTLSLAATASSVAEAVEFRRDGASHLSVGAGAFNIFQDDGHDDSSAAFQLEYRHGNKFWGIFGPAIGGMVNTDGAVNPYVGVYTDLAMGPIIVSPFAGAGYYAEGQSKDLGGPFEFRLALDVAYEFESQSRLGLRLSHLSNAYIYDRNPGAEELMLVYSFAIGE